MDLLNSITMAAAARVDALIPASDEHLGLPIQAREPDAGMSFRSATAKSQSALLIEVRHGADRCDLGYVSQQAELTGAACIRRPPDDQAFLPTRALRNGDLKPAMSDPIASALRVQVAKALWAYSPACFLSIRKGAREPPSCEFRAGSAGIRRSVPAAGVPGEQLPQDRALQARKLITQISQFSMHFCTMRCRTPHFHSASVG